MSGQRVVSPDDETTKNDATRVGQRRASSPTAFPRIHASRVGRCNLRKSMSSMRLFQMTTPAAEESSQKHRASFREIATDAIRYWEPRRLIYNAVLAVVVIVNFCLQLPDSRKTLQPITFLVIFVFAMIANLVYCAAYIVDVFAQFSDFRDFWRRFRWVLLTVGIIFGGVLTQLTTFGFFAPITGGD